MAASCVMVECSIPCTQSVSSALPEVRKVDISTRDVLKVMGARTRRKSETQTFWWSESPRRRQGTTCFPCFAHTLVDGGYCRVDIVDIENLRGGHLEFDPGSSTG